MGSFGERLKREREMRGIKLEEIAESTKIGKRNLTALEDERFDQLPGGIFNKGFVRAYAKFLGLDEEQMVSDYLAAAANYEQPSEYSASDSMVRPAALPSEASVRRKNRLWVIASLLILAAGFFVWLHYSRRAPHRGEVSAPGGSEQQSPSVSSTQASTVPSVAAAGPAEPSAGNAGFAAGDQRSATQADTTPAPANGTVAPVSTALTANTAGGTNVPAPGEGFTLLIQARETAWIALNADGQSILDVVLAAGESRSIRARRQITLKTGNAGGIDIRFNGAALPSLGAEKQVKTANFTPQGLQP